MATKNPTRQIRAVFGVKASALVAELEAEREKLRAALERIRKLTALPPSGDPDPRAAMAQAMGRIDAVAEIALGDDQRKAK